ncbi:MAG TPA: AsmA family protein [Flavitalea sp.]|nr:AsmA family protein [Flavitalea sp.]
MEPAKKKNWFKVILKWIGITIGSILLLLVILWFVLQTRWAQNIVRKEIVSYLEKKLDTKVRIARLAINYLYHLELDGVYVEDRSKESLVYIGKLEAGYKLLDLFNNTLTISSLEIDSINLNVYNKPADSLFNYDFIIKAFASADTTSVPDTLTTGTAMKFNIGDIEISRANLHYNDAFNGQDFTLTFTKIDVGVDKFNLDSMEFKLDHLYTENVAAGLRFKPISHSKQTDTTASSASPLPYIIADSVLLAGTRIIYIDENSAMDLKTVAAKLGLSGVTLNLNENLANIRSINLTDHSTKFAMNSGRQQSGDTAVSTDSAASGPFRFTIGNIAIQNNSIQYDDNGKPELRGSQMDYGHMAMSNLNTSISNVSFDGTNYKAAIKSLSFNE